MKRFLKFLSIYFISFSSPSEANFCLGVAYIHIQPAVLQEGTQSDWNDNHATSRHCKLGPQTISESQCPSTPYRRKGTRTEKD
ncbi:hypothetical protein BDZ94DRAFT_1248272 [Collybia nuda]|uniref:Secreted protein n=1 Tax=Collybia nuda TaxID=64659 RepID=A0A9P6CIE1_9AGAR|nr:hypothetical protein BDZ94DRAFT_1248272 [Collybia nuda]